MFDVFDAGNTGNHPLLLISSHETFTEAWDAAEKHAAQWCEGNEEPRTWYLGGAVWEVSGEADFGAIIKGRTEGV